MADVHSTETRSYNMSRIKGKYLYNVTYKQIYLPSVWLSLPNGIF